ncbi:hypothetical protein LTS18_002372, partial [Coniosporium uncinatum]
MGDVSQQSSFETSWSFIDCMSGQQSSDSSFLPSDVDDRVDLIGQHWDVIARTLTSLQYVVQKKILALLKPQARYARNPKLNESAFATDEHLRQTVRAAIARVARGVRIPRVRTGQGRWGRWREEARIVQKVAGSKEQSLFFSVLLSAFLGNHTDWLTV